MRLNDKEIVKDVFWDEIPDIELYADQIITLLNKTISDPEKFLTKSMINNYSKARILGKIKGRKYTKPHVIIIAIINRLKQTLTMNEIKYLMDGFHSLVLLDDDLYDCKLVKEAYIQYTTIFHETFANPDSMQAMLEEVASKNPKELYIVVEALCLSALAQSYQEKIRSRLH